MHCCPHCQRTYSRKNYFDRHVGVCVFLSKSKKEQLIEIEERQHTPTVAELYLVVMELVNKNKKLEEKVEVLSKGMKLTKKKEKLTLLEWLNVTYKNISAEFNTWLNIVQVSRANLEIFFETDYVGGVMSALKHQLPLADEGRPVRAFNDNNTFYVYIDNKWQPMDNEAYLKLMYAYDKKLMVEFGNWQKENSDKMYLDDFFMKYNKYMNKMMATRELMYSRIKKELHSYLREAQCL